jgi:hypothetical protein
MASSYEIKNGRLILKNNGRRYLDDSEKKHIPNNFTEIEFPACYEQVYDDDFDACKRGLAQVTKLDFTKAVNMKKISDGAFNGAKKLKVVVLPKKVEYISEFKNCPNLVEFHIYDLKKLYNITDDGDKRLTVYAYKVSGDFSNINDGFLKDVGTLYVPNNKLAMVKKARDKYNDKLNILPLPDGYTFPNHALSEPIGASDAVNYEEEDFDSSLNAASSYKIVGKRLIFIDNGESCIDDEEKESISGNFTEIEFPPCFDELYDDDFDACRDQLAKVTKLDFSKAVNIETIGNNTFTGAKSLKVVVLPKKVTDIPNFKGCPNLSEIHIYNFEGDDTGWFRPDIQNARPLTLYASKVDPNNMGHPFMQEMGNGTFYVPKNQVRNVKREFEDAGYGDAIILPLPDDYTFPTEALSEPWEPGGSSSQSEDETMLCPNCGERYSIDIDACPYCGFSASGSYEVVLVSTGRAKLQLIKAIKEACNYGLKEAKDIVDSALPASVIRGISKERAEEIKQAIEDAGGKAKINGGEKTATKKANSSTASVLTTSTAVPATPTSSAPKAITLEDIYGGPQYHCVLEGKAFGPVTIRQFANMVRFGIVDKNTMVWKNGMSNWALAQTVADLQVVL